MFCNLIPVHKTLLYNYLLLSLQSSEYPAFIQHFKYLVLHIQVCHLCHNFLKFLHRWSSVLFGISWRVSFMKIVNLSFNTLR